MPRALILSADIGAGHDLPAELLAEGLRARSVEPRIADGIHATGRVPHALGPAGSRRSCGAGVERLIARERPDVIVSTYPGTTEVLGRMRFAGRVQVPVVAAITDLAALR